MLYQKSEKIGKDQTVYLKPALKLEFGQNDHSVSPSGINGWNESME